MTDSTLTIPAVLSKWASETPDALVLTDDSREFAYGELQTEVDSAAQGLIDQGVAQGDRVLLVGDNSWQWVVIYLASLRIGAISVPMNNRLSQAQVAELAALVEPRIILSDAPHAAMFGSELPYPLWGLEKSIGYGHFWNGLSGARKLPELPNPASPAIISFTSGTTGVPKGAVLSQNALALGSKVILNLVRLTRTDSTLILAPLFHNIGFVDQLGQMLVAGGRTDLLRVYHTKDAVAAFARRPVTFITAVPSVLRLLMTAEGADHVYGPARTVIFGGSPMPAAWSAELLRRWPQLQLWHGYGLTEFTSACSLLPPRFIESHGESIGFPPPEVELRIVGGEGQDIVEGEVGEIWVAGPTRMIEYWKRPDATAVKVTGKWLRTGDMARRGEQGLLFHVGRQDDVINRGGEKILPSFVESVLAQRPDIAQCVVFGAPHPILQERVLAAVELRSKKVFDPDTVRAYLARHLPDYAVPEQILVQQTLPRTASGKIDRRAVRKAFVEGTLQANCK